MGQVGVTPQQLGHPEAAQRERRKSQEAVHYHSRGGANTERRGMDGRLATASWGTGPEQRLPEGNQKDGGLPFDTANWIS